jgi:hypothetical protein
MAHFAKIGLNNKVMSVIVVANTNCQNADGIEEEEVGRQFLENALGWPLWKKCSYNTQGGVHKEGGTPFRKNYPGICYTWDGDRDAFYAPKPHNSWILDENTCVWNAPIAYPSITTYGDNNFYQISWDEDNLRWVAYDRETPQGFFEWDPNSSTWISAPNPV